MRLRCNVEQYAFIRPAYRHLETTKESITSKNIEVFITLGLRFLGKPPLLYHAKTTYVPRCSLM